MLCLIARNLHLQTRTPFFFLFFFFVYPLDVAPPTVALVCNVHELFHVAFLTPSVCFDVARLLMYLIIIVFGNAYGPRHLIVAIYFLS